MMHEPGEESLSGDKKNYSCITLFVTFVSSRLLGSRTYRVGDFKFSRPWDCDAMCLLVIALLFYLYRFPGKKTQGMDIESKFVTAAKRSRKETTVEEILGESFIK